MTDNVKTIAVELNNEELALIKSGLMFIADTTNLEEKCDMCWNIINKMDI